MHGRQQDSVVVLGQKKAANLKEVGTKIFALDQIWLRNTGELKGFTYRSHQLLFCNLSHLKNPQLRGFPPPSFASFFSFFFGCEYTPILRYMRISTFEDFIREIYVLKVRNT